MTCNDEMLCCSYITKNNRPNWKCIRYGVAFGIIFSIFEMVLYEYFANDDVCGKHFAQQDRNPFTVLRWIIIGVIIHTALQYRSRKSFEK